MKKIYLAIPYTGMQESAYEQANLATVLLLNQNYNVFSPITHSHPLTLLDMYEIPHTWEYWQHIDYQFIDWCDEVWVLIPKEGIDKVRNSTGVQAEIDYAHSHNKPVKYIQIKNVLETFSEDLLSEITTMDLQVSNE